MTTIHGNKSKCLPILEGKPVDLWFNRSRWSTFLPYHWQCSPGKQAESRHRGEMPNIDEGSWVHFLWEKPNQGWIAFILKLSR